MEQTLNEQKHYNYKVQSQRLKKALEYGFLLEAVFIEYAMMEDRTEAILRYEGNDIKGDHVSINKKINTIKKIAEEKKSLANKYFKEEFLDQLVEWKNKRNTIMHAMMKQSMTTEGLLELALEGQQLVKDLNRISTNYKRAVERKTVKEVIQK